MAAPDPNENLFRFTFTGRAGEYFRIWIISLCLSLVTLGVYSAWGKVRKRRYLYAHTKLDGSGFDYRASPLAILRGRVLALLLFGGFALSGHFVPAIQWVFIALLLVLSPWIVIAAARFNARNSTYRNIAFAFDGGVREAAWVFVGGAVLSIATFGLAYPWYRMRRARFIIAQHRYGATHFATDLQAGGFVLTYLFAGLILLGAFAVLIGAGIALSAGANASTPPAEETSIAGLALIAVIYVVYVAVYAYIRSRTLNLMANATIIGPMRLRGTLRARRLAWLYVSNIAVVLATLGIATAWATIRVAAYRADNLYARANAPLETYSSGVSSRATATGSEVSDLFDVDVSL
ncbi:MAG TPA: YjgN family protein [Casimicrobiaceae bacterium]